MPLPDLQQVKAWVRRRSAQPVYNMALFTSGSLWAIGGLMLIIFAERLFAPSIGRELLAALGLVVAVGGGLRALYGYLAIGLFKLLEYFFSD